jgi:hypothetical protein
LTGAGGARYAQPEVAAAAALLLTGHGTLRATPPEQTLALAMILATDLGSVAATYALLAALVAAPHTTLTLQERPVTTLALQAIHTAIALTEDTDTLLGLTVQPHATLTLQDRLDATLTLQERNTTLTLTEG